RLGLLALPFWLTLTVTGLLWFVEKLRHRREPWSRTLHEAEPSPTLLRVLCGVVVVLFLLEVWGATTDRNFKATGTTIPGRQYLDRDQPVRLEVLPR
ncbi:MAG TPA: hypothetical protein VE685_07765, partial [Thermoanaerobaculia bacterium]|nr:hypothetical protein [Thermoanaerobaculia bacterium]